MADLQAHVKQAKKNLATLSETSQKIKDSWDWQVTMSYYAAVHLMNGHLAAKVNLHYKTHKDVKIALFDERLSCKLPDDIYYAYVSLENLSRRSRYLCHEDSQMDNTHEFKTFDRHLKKALYNLDIILKYFSAEYKLSFEKLPIDCLEIKASSYNYFFYKQSIKAA